MNVNRETPYVVPWSLSEKSSSRREPALTESLIAGVSMGFEPTHVGGHDDLQRIRSRVCREPDRCRGLFQGKAVREERADIESPGKNQTGHFGLQREIGGVAANEVFFVQTNRSQIEVEDFFCLGGTACCRPQFRDSDTPSLPS